MSSYYDYIREQLDKAIADGFKFVCWTGTYRRDQDNHIYLDSIFQKYPEKLPKKHSQFYLCLPIETPLDEVGEKMYEEYCRIIAKRISDLKIRIENYENSIGKIRDAYLTEFDRETES